MAKFRFTWAHGIVIALGSFMIFIMSLVFLAGDMGEMVDENYYQKTIEYQDDINAAQRANSLQHKPEIVKQANGYMIRFFDNQAENGEVLFMRLNDSRDDVREVLKLNDRNEQLVHSVKLKNGDYQVSIRWKQAGEDYLIKETIFWKDPS